MFVLWKLSRLQEHPSSSVRSRRSEHRSAPLSAAAIASILTLASPAAAGDPAPRPAPPSAADVPAPFVWAGFYIGSNFGGGSGSGSRLSGFETEALAPTGAVWTLPGLDPGGVLGGFQAGHNWQAGNVVFGLESDIQAAGLSGGSKAIAPRLAAAHQTIDWFGTTRARLGYAPTPTFLVYATGGLAYGGGGSRFVYVDALGNNSGEGFHAWTHAGFAAGGGLEWAFSPEWSAKLEYLYVDLGRSGGHAFNEANADGDTLTRAATLTGASNRFHAIRAGLSYHFDLAGGPSGSPLERLLAQPSSDRFHEIDTHYLFGFTEGADIDAEGEKELEFISLVRFGKRRLAYDPGADDFLARLARDGYAGDYRSIEQKIELEHTLTQNFQYSFGVIGANHRIRGVDGFDDYSGTSLRGLSAEARYVLLERGPSPFGVTFQVEPEWGHVSGNSGHRETAFEVETKLIVDTELVPDRFYGALNLVYEPEISRGLGENKWDRESTTGVTGGLTYRVTPIVALGGGLQYYRHHTGGFAFQNLDGQALFAGPSLHVRLTKKMFLSAAFSTQLRGHAGGATHALDLVNFTRHMARVQLGVEF